MTLGFRQIKEADGSLSVDQATVNGHAISWNPDDGRFYVHTTELADERVLGTFTAFRNAVQFAKQR